MSNQRVDSGERSGRRSILFTRMREKPNAIVFTPAKQPLPGDTGGVGVYWRRPAFADAGQHCTPLYLDRNSVVNRLVNKERIIMDLLRIILAIFIPPLGVFLQVGFGKHFWLNILLTLLGYIPGIVHAVWVIAKY